MGHHTLEQVIEEVVKNPSLLQIIKTEQTNQITSVYWDPPPPAQVHCYSVALCLEVGAL